MIEAPPTVLDDVRRALGRTETLRPPCLPDFVEPLRSDNSVSLVEQFTAEAIAVGAQVSLVREVEDLSYRVAEICRAAAVNEVVLSGSELLTQSSLKWQLEQHGLVASHVSSFERTKKEELMVHLAARQVGVTTATYAIAETGTVVVTSDEDQALLVSLLPPIHIAVIKMAQIKQRMTAVLEDLNRDYVGRAVPCRSATFITGPSRTGDVELTLSIGVHGPRELHLIILGS